ncbi:MAG: FHA domain-containing protein [Planctomycetota bacterium]
MAKLRIESDGMRRDYLLRGDRTRIGSGTGNEVQIADPGLAERHMVLIRRGADYSALAAKGAELRVNGERVTKSRITYGDQIEIGDTVLELLEESLITSRGGGLDAIADELSRELGAAGAKFGGGRRRRAAGRRGASRSSRSLMMTSGAIAVALALGFIAVRFAASDAFGKSAGALLQLAETQASHGRLEQALATLRAARDSDPDGETKRRIENLCSRVETTLQRRVDDPALVNAKNGLTSMEEFVGAYLVADPARRPACRELVRAAEAWLVDYRAVCDRYEDGREHIGKVQAMLDTYAPAAFIDEADVAEDVEFQAQHLTRLVRRRYGEAIALIDGFLGEHPEDARAPELRALRSTLASEGRYWVRRRLEHAQRLLETGDLTGARREVEFLRDQALPEWREWFDEAADGVVSASAG